MAYLRLSLLHIGQLAFTRASEKLMINLLKAMANMRAPRMDCKSLQAQVFRGETCRSARRW
jgi:hypothetical protein